MAISICSGDSTARSETHTLTRKQSLQRSCLSWSSIQSWTVRQVKGLTGDISPKMKAKGTEESVLLSQPAKTIAHGTTSTLSFDWLGYQVFKQSEFRRFCIKTQVPANLEKSEGWQPGVLPTKPLSAKRLSRAISFEVPHKPLPPP